MRLAACLLIFVALPVLVLGSKILQSYQRHGFKELEFVAAMGAAIAILLLLIMRHARRR